MAGGDPGHWDIWWQPDLRSRLWVQPSFYSSPLDLTAVLGLITGRVKGSHCWPAPGCALAPLLANNGLATLNLHGNRPQLTSLIPSTEVDGWRHIRE